MPSEILICPPMLDFKDVTTYIKQHTNALVELREDACFKDAVMEQTMADQFGADWRTTLGYEEGRACPVCCGGASQLPARDPKARR